MDTGGEGLCVNLVSVGFDRLGLPAAEGFFDPFASQFLLDVGEGGTGYARICSREKGLRSWSEL